MKHVSQEVFCRLMECETTDILFFVSSTFLRRFSNDPSFQRYIPLDPEKIRSTDAKEVHRYVCECYRGLIPSNSEYYLAPFSIQKEGNRANIYGVIFGSHSLLGLEKFLKVCWDQDQTTGEANYNIDSDAIRDGQLSLFPEENVIKKCDKFEKDLVALLADGPCSNQRLYRFCLEGGFLPKHGNDILRKLQNDGKIEVRDASTGQGVRRGAFYLSWSHVGSDGRHVNIVYKG